MKLTENLIQALRSGDGETACGLLMQASRAMDKALAASYDRENQRAAENWRKYYLACFWDQEGFLRIDEEDLRQEAWENWSDSPAASILADEWKYLAGDWDWAPLPSGIIHQIPECDEWEFVPWNEFRRRLDEDCGGDQSRRIGIVDRIIAALK